MPHSIRTVRAPLACLVGLLGCWTLTAAGDVPPAIADADYARLLEADSKLVESAAANPMDKKAAIRGKMAALMIALYAQNQFDKKPELMATRDAALQAFAAINNGHASAAKGLIASAKGAANGNPAKVDLHQHFTISDLMNQFGSEKGSGLGLEKKFNDHRKTGATSPELVDVLNKIALIAQYTEQFAPVKDEGKKTKADWVKWSQDLSRTAIEVASVAKGTPTRAELRKALDKVYECCAVCHTTCSKAE